MDSDDDLVVAMMGITLLLSLVVLQRRTVVRQFWVNPYLSTRQQTGRFFTAFQDMVDFPRAFEENFHMDHQTFELLLSKVEQYLLPKRQTRVADSISPKQRLAIALEYYASGSFQRHLASVYRLSKTTCCLIIQQVSTAIITALKTEMIEMNQENWLKMANEYNYKWQLPNCLEAFDGKHVAIKKPPGSGSEYFNYKRYHSIILMALVDANYRFISIDVGARGSEGDANVFSRSELGRMIKTDDPLLNLPPDAFVGGEKLPYFFIGDDAFPLLKRLIKPYN
ncbi:uncharacterized protein LOC129573202 [Sitodiplosis mosellana]|uniref:uncharacterized protein LOC129573202 n=1 Tax=Sitodiplosis mosellana TaxID=263140 RepID=UPI0024446DD7|nr:uncharacterized protein LOC129573202 [Sitodiplosis mosellana]